jgi:hypothetical protein
LVVITVAEIEGVANFMSRRIPKKGKVVSNRVEENGASLPRLPKTLIKHQTERATLTLQPTCREEQ